MILRKGLPLVLLACRLVFAEAELRARSYQALADDHLEPLLALSDLSSLDYDDPSSRLASFLVPRVAGSDALIAIQKQIKQAFADLSKSSTKASGKPTWQLDEHEFEASTPIGSIKMTNLVFTHDPEAELKLILSAHIDSKYFPRSPMNTFVGATDSAVPTAVIMDVAEALTPWLDEKRRAWEESEERGPRTTLQIVIFDGEEAFERWTDTDSIYGARALAEMWSKPSNSPTAVTARSANELGAIDVLVLLDLLGTPSPNVPNFYGQTKWYYNVIRNAEDRLGRNGHLWSDREGDNWRSDHDDEKGRSFFPLPGHDRPVYGIEDDHIPFLHRGVPIVHLIPAPFPAVWHTLRDDASGLDLPTIHAWALIVRLATAEYLGLSPGKASGERDEMHPRRAWQDDLVR
ncbi:hypothetical protein E5Q_00831 [Mixia osmundae IAM 14324]|uniref:Peptide hydrolase n=1 Tax=Mixia osmundae (strain CBS 9802 / IAM 14324 / JCM 22182 / KY 12970) TaxID=764103 RepID=G7DUC3_MIXOS|nr:hypothetical protein E5Q_00831 [Mixia osmundae IAM 14324]